MESLRSDMIKSVIYAQYITEYLHLSFSSMQLKLMESATFFLPPRKIFFDKRKKSREMETVSEVGTSKNTHTHKNVQIQKFTIQLHCR